VHYVAELIGPDAVSTMPEHPARVRRPRSLDAAPDDAERMLAAAAASGLDLAAITAELQREGVRSFCDAYHQLLSCIERKTAAGTAR
jgi:transaldolase